MPDFTKSAAYDHVFGYTLINDVTARKLQNHHKQWFLGKSLAGFCPVGPCLVTADEFGTPDAQELATYVNGERRQFARLRDMIFDVGATIEACVHGGGDVDSAIGHIHVGEADHATACQRRTEIPPPGLIEQAVRAFHTQLLVLPPVEVVDALLECGAIHP